MSAKGLHISGLVNNAGYGHPGMYLDSSWEDHAKFIQLMMTAPCELAHKLSPAMVENGFGRIINVASLAGHMPGSKGHTLYAGGVNKTIATLGKVLPNNIAQSLMAKNSEKFRKID